MSEVITGSGSITVRNTENDKKFYGLKWQLEYPITEVSLSQLSAIILAGQNTLEKKHSILLKFNMFKWDIEGNIVVVQPEFVCATHFIPKEDNWKSEKNLSHYEIEQSNRMLILETLRALDNAGVENEYVNNFLNEKLEKTYKCLATSPEYAATLPVGADLTKVPNSEENAATGLKSANT